MTGLAAGYCIGIVGDTGVRAYMEQSRIFVGMVLILIFGEVLGLYGYVGLDIITFQVLTHRQTDCCAHLEHQEQGLKYSIFETKKSNHVRGDDQRDRLHPEMSKAATEPQRRVLLAALGMAFRNV